MAGSCACGMTSGVFTVAGASGASGGQRDATGCAAGVATRPAGSSVLCGDALDGDAEPVRLVDEVVGDAAAREGDDALGE